MSDTIIKVENLSKKYTISHEGREQYTALRDVITNRVKGLFKSREQRLITGEEEDFWALKDVNFEIKQGEAVGIIGRNGAGKSTLLKILSRITEPTTGKITLNGRVASLLEVGTGFHPELTGRENIYLNGAILGMSRVEIKKKFDEIVDFSGVEKFLDMPIKRFSSGMYVRLAFAVAAHLEPEILVVDEVLAVGDAEFQKKCLGKMDDVAKKEGRTVLFVSHDMGAVSTLTSKSIWMAEGKVARVDKTSSIIKEYNEQIKNAKTDINKIRKGNIIAIKSINADYNLETKTLEVILEVDKLKKDAISFEFILKTSSRQKIALASLMHFQQKLFSKEAGCYRLKFVFEQVNLASGLYFIDIACSVPNISWDIYEEDAIQFEVLHSIINNSTWDFKSDYGYGNIAWLIQDFKQKSLL